MMSLNGWGYWYLAGAREDGRWEHSPVVKSARKEPFVDVPAAEFMQVSPSIKKHLTNIVKVCPNCSKNCGITLHACNNCDSDISKEKAVATVNALMAFVYGLRGFPTSIRYEDESYLVYDDLMQTTSIHLNSIPTEVYVPDFRYLLSEPRRGLQLIDSLFGVAVKAASTMLSDEAFRRRNFSTEANKLMSEVNLETLVRQSVVCGCNYPPSQHQLHLQFILPPYLPYHAVLLAEGKHTEIERFFPLEYIRKCLEELINSGSSFAISDLSNLSGKEIISLLNDTVGTDYYKIYVETVQQQKAIDRAFRNWHSEDFQFAVIDKEIVVPLTAFERGDVIPDLRYTPAELLNKDRATISSYGKGKGLQFYSHAKSPGQVSDWNAHILSN
jgi:hypothetical protein